MMNFLNFQLDVPRAVLQIARLIVNKTCIVIVFPSGVSSILHYAATIGHGALQPVGKWEMLKRILLAKSERTKNPP